MINLLSPSTTITNPDKSFDTNAIAWTNPLNARDGNSGTSANGASSAAHNASCRWQMSGTVPSFLTGQQVCIGLQFDYSKSSTNIDANAFFQITAGTIQEAISSANFVAATRTTFRYFFTPATVRLLLADPPVTGGIITVNALTSLTMDSVTLYDVWFIMAERGHAVVIDG